MEKNDNRYKEFLHRLKKYEQFKEEISHIFDEEYQELFENILLTKKENFLKTFYFHIKLLLKDKYTSHCLEHAELISLMDKYEKKYNLIYSEDMKIINNCLSKDNIILNNKNKYIENGENFIFLKHCKFQEETPLHSCNKKNNFYLLKIEKTKKLKYSIKKYSEIYAVLCMNCFQIYKSNFIKLYCNFDSINYFTKILSKDISKSKENSDLQPATWEKYHCHLIINQQMQCIKCQQNNLYIKLKENKLYCPKCQFISEPTMILWTCISCGQEFTTNAKIYNPYEYKPISMAIKNSIFNNEIALPLYNPCKGHKCENFTHKKECNGKLYITYLHERKMVICQKCKAMTKYNKYIWCCKICGIKFRDDGSYNENIEINNDNNIKDSINQSDNGEAIFGKNNFYDLTLPNKKDEINHLEQYKKFQLNNENKNNSQILLNNKSSKAKNLSNLSNANDISLPFFKKCDYDIISELNEGKRSKVYCVKDNENKFYAMKVKEIDNLEESEYFEEKYKLQYNFDSKYFVKLYSINPDIKKKELCSLFDLGLNNWQSEINSMKKVPKFYNESLLVSIIYQISNGLCDLFNKGYLHLNINPHNIIIFSDSIYKIADCEMSIDYETLINDFNSQERQLTTEEIIGILDSGNRYMSPKFKLMIKNRIKLDVDYLDKNDVFSLGLCILSTMNKQKDDKIIINEFVYLGTKLYNDLVNDTSNKFIKEKINFYTKDLGYSKKLINLLYNMMNINDSERFDFKQIIDYITKEYNL